MTIEVDIYEKIPGPYLVPIDSFFHYRSLKDLKYGDSYANNFRNFTGGTWYGSPVPFELST